MNILIFEYKNFGTEDIKECFEKRMERNHDRRRYQGVENYETCDDVYYSCVTDTGIFRIADQAT